MAGSVWLVQDTNNITYVDAFDDQDTAQMLCDWLNDGSKIYQVVEQSVRSTLPEYVTSNLRLFRVDVNERGELTQAVDGGRELEHDRVYFQAAYGYGDVGALFVVYARDLTAAATDVRLRVALMIDSGEWARQIERVKGDVRMRIVERRKTVESIAELPAEQTDDDDSGAAGTIAVAA